MDTWSANSSPEPASGAPAAPDLTPVNPALPARRRASGLRRALLTLTLGAACLGTACPAAELHLDFATVPQGDPPAAFRPALTGGGPAPEWKVIQVDAPRALPTVTDRATQSGRETVLAQLSQDPTDERFPLLIYQPEEFGDFIATLRFRTVAGRVERMAGLAFRLRDERNYYVIRASSLGNTLRFYKFVDGARSDPIGPDLPIPAGEWHTLEIAAKGNHIAARLDGKDALPTLTDTSFTRGRFALWTKSDSVSHFASLRVEYDLLRTLPQQLVDRATKNFPRLLGITVFAREAGRLQAIASSKPEEVGRPGSATEEKTLADGLIQAGSTRDVASAVFPLRDRNGDPMFAVRLEMKRFSGQTDANVAARGKAIIDDLEQLMRAAERSDRGAIPTR